METREKVKNVFDSHVLVRIATVDEFGFPQVRSVDFAPEKEDESIFYFMTYNISNKVKELQKNNNVHIVVDKDANLMEELAQIVYVRGSGKAYQVQSPEEMQKGMGLILGKYPYLQNMPGDPSMMTLFRVELDKVIVTDNNRGFGHIEEYTYR